MTNHHSVGSDTAESTMPNHSAEAEAASDLEIMRAASSRDDVDRVVEGLRKAVRDSASGQDGAISASGLERTVAATGQEDEPAASGQEGPSSGTSV